MKNIITIHASEVASFVYSLWSSKEFKHLHLDNKFFDALMGRLSLAPLYHYEYANARQRNHLTSHFRFIAKREYENPYIQDLYYFHELCHCAQFLPEEEETPYTLWSMKLSENELYASLMSEAFIYFLQPSLVGKTFPHLWVERFLKPVMEHPGYQRNSWGFVEDSAAHRSGAMFNPFSIKVDNWSQPFAHIIQERHKLRQATSMEGLDDAQQQIVRYNQAHQRWILLWSMHYRTIEKLLKLLHCGELSATQYKAQVLANVDDFGRPFFPAKMGSPSTFS